MDKETESILSACSVSTRAMAKTFFPERFYQPFAEQVHGEIFKIIDSISNRDAIGAPRGWGKTSIVALALMARYILFRLTPFIVYINKSETAALMQTDNLKRELMSNKVIKAFFGSIHSRNAGEDEMEEQFSRKAWVAWDTLVLPRGAGQQVRGILFKNDRPGLIVIDDLEDKDKVMNPDLRAQLKTWFYSDVLECIPQIHMNWKIIYIDTLKHEDSLLQHLLITPGWNSTRLEACNDNFESVAPDFVSNEIMAAKWKAAQEAGETDTFYQENRNLPISRQDATFKHSYFRYYNFPLEQVARPGIDLAKYDHELQYDENVETIVLLDPAKTVKTHSAESAIIGIGIDTVNGRFYIRDAIAEKMYPEEIYENLFNMADRLSAKVIGVEETSLNEFIKQPIKNYMLRRGTFYELVWLNARGGMKKELRVKELVPYYRLGYIYHNASCKYTLRLESQLLSYPRSALWDMMDCEAYLIQMLELGKRYFMPLNTSDEPATSESEYAELTYEEPIEDWRVA